MSQSVVKYKASGGDPGGAEEEWVTTKKVDIVTTTTKEKKIQRQIVLEDGRVVEEEIPVVTVDTTEDTQTFQTDQDEDRELAGGQEGSRYLASKFDTNGSVLVGDKFTRVKKINDVTESLVKTEALQNIGDIRSKDLKKCLDEKNDIRKYLRSREGSDNQIVVAPKVLLNKRNHRIVTDQEDVQERNWINKGKMQNERIKTEEHIEYDSDDSTSDGSSSSSSKSSRHKLEPEVYKTRKDENYTEYFKIHKNQPKSLKIGEGPHYVSESKEVHRVDDNQLQFIPSPVRPSRSNNRNHRTFLMSDYEPSSARRPLNHTDSWLERHFGSTSSLSQTGSGSSELSRPGSRDGPSGLRRSASICDIRPVANSSGEFYATVRKSGKIPDVPLREKKDRSYYSENRRSANFSSTGHPVRPPRRQKSSENGYSSLSRQSHSSDNRHYASLSFRRPETSNPTDKYYFGGPVTVKKYSGSRDNVGAGAGLTRSYSSVQNVSSGQMGHVSSRRPEYHNSMSNIYSTNRRNEPHHLMMNNNRREKPKPEVRERYRSETRDREKIYGSKTDSHYSRGMKENNYNRSNYSSYSVDRYNNPKSDYQYLPQNDIKQSHRHDDSHVTKNNHKNIHYDTKYHHQDIYAVPHKIIYDTTSGGQPFTKFRTRIVINSES